MIIRVIASFLFAIVILVFGHFGAWWLAAQHAQDKIISSLNSVHGLTVTPGNMTPRGYPHNVTLEIDGMALNWQSPNGERSIELKANKLKLETPMFDMRKAQASLDQEVFVTIRNKGEVMREFRAVIGGGKFSSFWRPDNTTEYAFNFNNITLWDVTDSSAPVLRASTGYVVRETPGVRTPVSWRVSFKDIVATSGLVGEAFTLNRLVAGVGFETGFFTKYGPDMLSLIAKSRAERKQARNRIAETVEEQRRPNLTIDSLQVENNDNWVSLRGGFGLNDQHYLDGKISINTNDLEPVFDFLSVIDLFDEKTVRNSRELERIKDSGVVPSNVGITFERDRAYVNSRALSVVPPLPKIIGSDKK